jgi:DNA-binding NarL/FixJ family response regulator
MLTPRAIRVHVVSESRIHREGLALRLSSEPGILPVGSSDTIMGAERAASCGDVDAVVIDAESTPENLGELAAAVRSAPGVHFVPLLSADSESEIVAWVEAGASAIVDCRAQGYELKDVLEAARRGELLCSRRVAGVLLRRVRTLASSARPPDVAGRLTQRERGVLVLVSRGLSNKEIAGQLGLKLATVKNHVHSIFEKLDVSNRAMAVSLSLSVGEQHHNGTSTTDSSYP